MSGPHAAVAAAHVPGFGACVVLDDVVAVAEVVTVAPVPLVVDEELLLVVVLEVVVDVLVTSGLFQQLPFWQQAPQ